MVILNLKSDISMSHHTE